MIEEVVVLGLGSLEAPGMCRSEMPGLLFRV